MISFVAESLNLIALTLQNIFLIASFIGRLIVSTITGTSSAIFSIVENIFYFLQIVYEDNVSIFADEIPSLTNNLIDTLVQQLTGVQSGINIVSNGIASSCLNFFGTIENFITGVFVLVKEILLIARNTVIFLGDTLWIILTFIPLHLPVLLKTIVLYISYAVINEVVSAYMSLLKVTNFLTDVPLQSFIGIAGAIIIVRLSIHFQDYIHNQALVIYWSCITRALYLYYTACNWFNPDPDVREITQTTGGQITEAVDFVATNIDDGSDGLCVICAERQKCVLILPCRHVCLCADCCRRLYRYQRTCPICRTFIYHSVMVYL